MAIKQLFDTWKSFVEDYCRLQGDEPPVCKLSADAISEQDSPPRIVMVPIGGPIKDSTGQAGFGEQVKRPAALKARHLRFDFHVWGKDFDESESLMNHAVAALHDMGWGADKPIHEDWQKGAGSTARAGELVILSVEIEIPLVREPVDIATVQDFAPMTPEMEAPQ